VLRLSPRLRLGGYRRLQAEDAPGHVVVARAMEEARDALDLCVLSLDGQSERANQRGIRARALMLEAAAALSAARVYRPGIRTYSPAVVLDADPDPYGELARLRALATQMLWTNHPHFPAKRRAMPLPPEDEAQIEALFASFTVHAKRRRAWRHRWLLGAAIAGAAAPALGAVAFVTALGCAALGLVELSRGSTPALPAHV
jgi:hypothetical protein